MIIYMWMLCLLRFKELNFIGSIISGAASLFGNRATNRASTANTAAANQMSYKIAKETNEFNAKQAQLNRDWQERMSNTAHVRQVADLRKAGLNPILSVNSGAAMGPGATASGVNPNIKAAEHDYGDFGVSAAMNARTHSIQRRAVKAQTNATKQTVRELKAKANMSEIDEKVKRKVASVYFGPEGQALAKARAEKEAGILIPGGGYSAKGVLTDLYNETSKLGRSAGKEIRNKLSELQQSLKKMRHKNTHQKLHWPKDNKPYIRKGDKTKYVPEIQYKKNRKGKIKL
jgi:hypothetical protein